MSIELRVKWIRVKKQLYILEKHIPNGVFNKDFHNRNCFTYNTSDFAVKIKTKIGGLDKITSHLKSSFLIISKQNESAYC